MTTAVCHFCHGAIASLDDCLILDHPHKKMPRAFFTHGICGEEHDEGDLLGYYIELKRIVAHQRITPEINDDSLDGWTMHLWGKRWFNPGLAMMVVRAHEVAKGIRKAAVEAAKPQPVIAPIPTTPAKPRSLIPENTLVRDARQRVTSKLRLFVFARDEHKCVQCGSPTTRHVDHILPVSRGGSAEPDNLQSLCVPCNQRKGASLPPLVEKSVNPPRTP